MGRSVAQISLFTFLFFTFSVAPLYAAASCVSLTHNLQFGSQDADTGGEVTKLQTFLNQDPSLYPKLKVSGFFDSTTQSAVANWQKSRGIVSSGSPATTGYGAVGAKTRAAMAACAPAIVTVAPKPAPAPSPAKPAAPATYSGTRTLSRGVSGADVTTLQQFLISQKLLSADSATGYFGALTEAAVQKFQTAKGIVSSGTPSTTGYGSVGPKTRAVIAQTSSAPPSTASTAAGGATSTTVSVATTTIPTPTPTPTPSLASCTFNGQSVASGATVTAYQASAVPYGGKCVSETRVCTNGTLNGSYTNATCAPAPAPPAICGTIDTSAVLPAGGNDYYVIMDAGFPADTNEKPLQSTFTLYENGVPLGPAHSTTADITNVGGGRYSYWFYLQHRLYFSTSDNSDPRTNGRTYTYGGPCRVPKQLEMIKLSSAAPGYATFQSHDQKMVSNPNGIFLDFWSNVTGKTSFGGLSGEWQLMRSQDGGVTFQTTYTGKSTCGAPSLDQDQNTNIYLFGNDCSANPAAGATLYKFSSSNGYTAPIATTPIVDGDSGKYTSYYDPTRNQLYYFTWDRDKHLLGGNFWVLGLDGSVIRRVNLVADSATVSIEYPQLTMMGPKLIAAWTTNVMSSYLYKDIHFMISDDGGVSWHRLDGTPLTLPVLADDASMTGGDEVVPASEFGYHNWLSNMFAKGDALHLFYRSSGGTYPEHYVQYNLISKVRDIFTQNFKGNKFSIHNLDGYFTSLDTSANSRLYVVSMGDLFPGESRHRVVVLASDDNGASWFDYAYGPQIDTIYSITGSRILSSDGYRHYVEGMFTSLTDPNPSTGTNVNDVWYFRVPAEDTQ